MTPQFGASSQDWEAFSALAGVDLLPVVSDPSVPVADHSKLKSVGKVPSVVSNGAAVGIARWTEHLASSYDVARWSAEPSLGICLQTRHYRAFDIDIDDGAESHHTASLIASVLGQTAIRTRANSGRMVLLYRCDEPVRKHRIVLDSGAIELLGDGCQVVVAGTHTSGSRYEWPLGLPEPADIPSVTVDQIAAVWDALATCYGSDTRFAKTSTAVVPAGEPLADEAVLADLKSALPFVDATDYDLWIKCGIALKGIDAMELWLDWSQQDERFDPSQAQEKWDSFAPSEITYKSIFTWAAEGGWSNPGAGGRPADPDEFDDVTPANAVAKVCEVEAAMAYWMEQITGEQNASGIREKMTVGIRSDMRLNADARDTLARVMGAELRRLKQPTSLSILKKMITPADTRAIPPWLRDWVYLSSDEVFVARSTGQRMTAAAFRIVNLRNVGEDEDPVYVAMQKYEIPHADGAMYMPGADPVFEFQGIIKVNSYRPQPPLPEGYRPTDAEFKGLALIRDHLSRMLGSQAPLFEDWLAHNVQRPGAKIRFAPIIRGTYGDGKTALGTMIGVALGARNVNLVSATAVSSNFNGWGEGHSLVIMEEIRMVGHNRHDILNALKPLISNDVVSVHRKGKDEYKAANTSNYMGFTNFDDALPVEHGDRRYWIMSSPYRRPADMLPALAEAEKEFGLEPGSYFAYLHDFVERSPDAIRYWLLNHKISAAWRPNGTAPHTEYKEAVIELARSETELEIEDALAVGGVGYNENIVSTVNLMADHPKLGGDRNSRGYRLRGILMHMGFVYIGRIWWDNGPRRVWAKTKVSVDQAKEMLDKTLSNKSDIDFAR